MSLEIADLFAEAGSDPYALHARHLNERMVRVLKTIGFDWAYQRGKGQYLYDRWPICVLPAEQKPERLL
jgi:ornithine--oxo-acid transaminase